MPIKRIADESPSKKSKLKIKLTHPDKILYPEDNITKEQLIEYYETVSDWILPYVSDRLLTLLRCPNGYDHCFYQRHEAANTKNSPIKSKLIKEKEGKTPYLYIDSEAGLLTLPQNNTLEIHPWGSRIDELEYPDTIIFDLDPAPEVEWKNVVKAAFDVKEKLEALKLKCFVKTTGGKGLHVVVPIKPEYDWDQIKLFTKTFVNYMALENPNLYITKMTKAHRTGKIFLDYLRNQRSATAIAPYSTRARIHAPVATPVHWDELTNHYQDTFFTIKTIPARLSRLKSDPWQGFSKSRKSIRLEQYLKKK